MVWFPLQALDWRCKFQTDSFDLNETVSVEEFDLKKKLKTRYLSLNSPTEDLTRQDSSDLRKGETATPTSESGSDCSFSSAREDDSGLHQQTTLSLTRIFVRLPFGETVPVDVDLSWTAQVTVEHLLIHCGLEDFYGDEFLMCGLRFRGKALRLDRTLKECGAELGSVIHLLDLEQGF
eukprot:TRINITY_DN100476_c0_g1_i1.p1 TRINITY_DN100476_c0_g1~~TRINITY_DN100476_c0_g1_i1.p1  ORF type:complete len:195 (-),score=28.50 TRINITY_DN100476_c0_g1_i1:114-647(-)